MLRRVLLSAFAWRATGEEAFLDRAKADRLAVATFQDWNPNHLTGWLTLRRFRCFVEDEAELGRAVLK